MPKVERITYYLACTVCKNRNYYYQRNKKKKLDKKLEFKKYCSYCRKHTSHKESK